MATVFPQHNGATIEQDQQNPPPQQYPAPQQQDMPVQQYPPTQQQYPPPQQQYPPPQQQYPPPQAPTANTVMVLQTGSDGAKCPSCQNKMTPMFIKSRPRQAWIWVLVLFLIGFIFPLLWCGCCLIPLCVVKETRRKCAICSFDMGAVPK